MPGCLIEIALHAVHFSFSHLTFPTFSLAINEQKLDPIPVNFFQTAITTNYRKAYYGWDGISERQFPAIHNGENDLNIKCVVQTVSTKLPQHNVILNTGYAQ